MAIKNWTVTVESTKSCAAREIYLNDMKHKNHKNTNEIVQVFGSANTMLEIERNCEAYKFKQQIERKGGRPPSSAAMEFVFTLPKGEQFKPTQGQWQQMIRGTVTAMAVKAGMSDEEQNELGKMIRAVVHRQNDDGKGSGDHCHVVFGKFTPSGKYLRDLQKKGVMYTAKQAFNKAVRDVMKVDHNQYIAEKQYAGVAKKRVPQWKVKAGRKQDELKEKEKLINADAERIKKRQEELDLERDEMMVKQVMLDAQDEEMKRSVAFLKLFDERADKWLEAVRNGDMTQINRQSNRIIKSVNENQNIVMSEEHSMRCKEMLDMIRENTDKEVPELHTHRPKFKMH